MTELTNDMKINVMRDLKNIKDIKQVAIKYDMSYDDVEDILKSVIKQALNSGKSVGEIAMKLGMSVDNVNKYGGVKAISKPIPPIENPIQFGGNNMRTISDKLNDDIVSLKDEIENKFSEKETKKEDNESDKIIQAIETENKLMELIIKNKDLHKQIEELIKSGEINISVKDVLSRIRQSS
jgi:hypothetical protein